MDVIQCTKIVLSEEVFSSIIATIAYTKAMDRLRLNA